MKKYLLGFSVIVSAILLVVGYFFLESKDNFDSLGRYRLADFEFDEMTFLEKITYANSKKNTIKVHTEFPGFDESGRGLLVHPLNYYLFEQNVELDIDENKKIYHVYENIHYLNLETKQSGKVTDLDFGDFYENNIGFRASLSSLETLVLNENDLWVAYELLLFDNEGYTKDVEAVTAGYGNPQAIYDYQIDEFNGYKSGLYMKNLNSGDEVFLGKIDGILINPNVANSTKKLFYKKQLEKERTAIYSIDLYEGDHKPKLEGEIGLINGSVAADYFAHIEVSPDGSRYIVQEFVRTAHSPIMILNEKLELIGAVPWGRKMSYGEPKFVEGGIILQEDTWGDHIDNLRRSEANFSPDGKYVTYMRGELKEDYSTKGSPHIDDFNWELIAYPIEQIGKSDGKEKEDQFVLAGYDENITGFEWYDEDELMYKVNEDDDGRNAQYKVVRITDKKKIYLFNAEYVGLF